ncbi:MAG TPA: AraC family transcriptional regulator [Flavisolibacter sp.]|nr:AraC family transcriptional regulator [Flavisolibacter sp.]
MNNFEQLQEISSLLTDPVVAIERQIPGSVQLSIKRYPKPNNWLNEERAVFQYNYAGATSQENTVHLTFCITGKMYCRKGVNECSNCKAESVFNCDEKVEMIDFLQLTFSSNLLEQFLKSRFDANNLSEDILAFKYTSSFTRSLPVCGRTKNVLEDLLNHNYTGSLENIYVNAQTQMLLLYSLDCMDDKEIDIINCKFLNNEADREKILKARQILLKHIGEPITIKQLSKKVAMNECYLKKGFKEMFGATIFEFYQSQRMEHAKYLLYEKGLNVTEVSSILGYSSISHFSTAFKKHTGLKPCELLLR